MPPPACTVDNVYSDAHADKDTYSQLKNMVPEIDARVPGPIAQVAEKHPPIRNAHGHARNPRLPADKPLLPARSVMGIGVGPGRSIDF